MKPIPTSLRAVLKKPAAVPVAAGIIIIAGILIARMNSASPDRPAWNQFLDNRITAVKALARNAWQDAGISAANSLPQGQPGGDYSLTVRQAQGSLAQAVAELQQLQNTCGRESHEVLTSVRRVQNLCHSLLRSGLRQEDLEMILTLLNRSSGSTGQQASAAHTRTELERMIFTGGN